MPTPSCSVPRCIGGHRLGAARFLARPGALITSFPAGLRSPGQPGSQHLPSSALQAKPGWHGPHSLGVPRCPAAARGHSSSPRQQRGKERFQESSGGTGQFPAPSHRPRGLGDPGAPCWTGARVTLGPLVTPLKTEAVHWAPSTEQAQGRGPAVCCCVSGRRELRGRVFTARS